MPATQALHTGVAVLASHVGGTTTHTGTPDSGALPVVATLTTYKTGFSTMVLLARISRVTVDGPTSADVVMDLQELPL